MAAQTSGAAALAAVFPSSQRPAWELHQDAVGCEVWTLRKNRQVSIVVTSRKVQQNETVDEKTYRSVLRRKASFHRSLGSSFGYSSYEITKSDFRPAGKGPASGLSSEGSFRTADGQLFDFKETNYFARSERLDVFLSFPASAQSDQRAAMAAYSGIVIK